MLVGGLLLLMAVAVAIAMALVPRSRSTETGVGFCPDYETVVERKGDRCFAIDDERCVSSIWDCQRSCLAQAHPGP